MYVLNIQLKFGIVCTPIAVESSKSNTYFEI